MSSTIQKCTNNYCYYATTKTTTLCCTLNLQKGGKSSRRKRIYICTKDTVHDALNSSHLQNNVPRHKQVVSNRVTHPLLPLTLEQRQPHPPRLPQHPVITLHAHQLTVD